MNISSNTHRILVALFSLLGFICLSFLLALALRTSLILLVIVFTLAYILNPLIIKLENKYHFKRSYIGFCVSIITLVLIIIIPLTFIPIMLNQIREIALHIPDLLNFINIKILANINAKFGAKLMVDENWIKNYLVTKGALSKLSINSILPIAKGGLEALGTFIDFVLMPFILFYVIKFWNSIVDFFFGLIPKRYFNNISNLMNGIDKSLSFYLRGQILVILVMAVYYVVTLNLARLPAATIIGIICGILVFIPYIGFSISIVMALMLGFSQFTGITQIAILLGIFGVGCLIENFVATPYLIGDSIGLNPIMIIFALIICGNLFGLIGVIIALPLTAISVVLFKHLYQMYLNSNYYNAKD